MALTESQFRALCARLDLASNVLRDHECYLQAIARRYYIVFTMATFAAAKHGIVAVYWRNGKAVVEDEFTHKAMPDVIRVLYTGARSGNIEPASGVYSGIVGANLRERDAVTKTNQLQIARKWADYGYTDDVEPYTPQQTDEHLNWANLLTEDLKKAL